MEKRYIAALDQGTTSSRCILFDRDQNMVGMAQKEFTQFYPKPGWVEHDPMEIWSSQYGVLMEVLAQSGVDVRELAGIGITNQRETAIVWDRDTGRPVYNAIVWQCRRTAGLCEELKQDPDFVDYVKDRTGLLIDAYFSAAKIKWILDHVPGAREQAEAGKLLFGTVDSWLIWKLTGGKVHVTDPTNASRTMLYDIRSLDWDEKICRKLDIPMGMLPQVRSSSEVYGTVNIQGVEVPIAGIAGDQQAALFGQTCFRPGEAKNTYGTGCFLLMNTGETPFVSKNGLLTTIAVGLNGKVQYALEGSVFVGGAVVQWLRDEMGLISDSSDTEYFAGKVADTAGVYVVPAFTGRGATTSSGRRWSPSPTRPPTFSGLWRRTPVSPCGSCGWTAGPRPTTSSCSSRRTWWTGPCPARTSGRPPPWGRRIWPGWPLGCGPGWTTSGAAGPWTGATSPPWRRSSGKICCLAGTRR